eukprot:CAMPEP_0201964238 /NCGR_PEP_ID=MMETSP0904-20121228/9910_1 /ASSEMBLY_ACC=CAM_ASM_000553 /TAXON_ID=420261 /ORGANISM="Thalassiosira antarctica, Strain CCMP982" /LENGTH=46 /DNA_ID= /DNA_START= /DNA_END= /DNA_ORIENTATION=
MGQRSDEKSAIMKDVQTRPGKEVYVVSTEQRSNTNSAVMRDAPAGP